MRNRLHRQFLIPFILVFFLLSLPYTSVQSQQVGDIDWSFLSTTTIGARQFIQNNPQYDGRGIVIFILDSGVDMSIPGLRETSERKTKVIDVQDFSGQGDVLLYAGAIKAEDQEKFIQHPDGFRLYNYYLLNQKPIDGEYLIGYLDENRFRNSDVRDINNNGIFDDLFGILAFEVESGDSRSWVAYVDTDGDHHLDDEKPIRDYRVNHDTFQLRGGDKKYDRRLMSCALNILADEMKVSLHFDDSGHGTHVAGIAAGFMINDQNGLNGIAPGAQIISLKIGRGNYQGSCTVTGSLRKALNFVEDYVRRHRTPAVINISYGIGSIREGQSDIDHIVSDILTFNDDIFISVSNGNDGPGISTTGTPAAARSAFSVGALLPVSVARDCYGSNLDTDKIFYFSARGGELNKPDALAPGAASSTIPTFTDDNLMRGTSMAAPQVAGAAALLLSSALQSSPKLVTKNILLHRALKFSSNPLQGYSYLDQGSGVVNISQAFKLLKNYSTNSKNVEAYEYEITTECPSSSDGISASAYWRNGGYYPVESEKQTFTIRPIFNDSVAADTRANFYRAYDLKASHPWMSLITKSVYIKGEKSAAIEVTYNSELITLPGLYCGKIVAYRKQSGTAKYDPSNIEFELLSSIIVPYIFDHSNKYHQDFQKRRIVPGEVDRYFVLVPVGATTAKLNIAPTKNSYCKVNCFAYTPTGINYFMTKAITSKEQNQESQIIPAADLAPGIWEIDVYADFQGSEPSVYDLSMSFSSFKIEPPIISALSYPVGQEPNSHLKITNQFSIPFYGFGRGKLAGYQRTVFNEVKDRDTFNYDFNIESDIERIEFEIDFDDASFLKFTDVAINIYDPAGTAVSKDALNQDKIKVILDRIAAGHYIFEIVAAHAYSSYDANWKFILTEKYYTDDVINIKIYEEVDRLFKLYPFVPNELEFTLSNSPRIPPDGFSIFGTIEFVDRNLLQQVFTVPVEFSW